MPKFLFWRVGDGGWERADPGGFCICLNVKQHLHSNVSPQFVLKSKRELRFKQLYFFLSIKSSYYYFEYFIHLHCSKVEYFRFSDKFDKRDYI